MFKKLIALLLVFILAIFPCQISTAAVDANMNAQMENVYTRALAMYRQNTGDSSFHGNCGVCISYILSVLGIDDYLGGFRGNQWFYAYPEGMTLGKYTVVKFAGADCLEQISKQYGTVSNLVVSYTHQTHYTNENPGAGHALFINHMEDGKLYFTESYGMYGVPEGKAHVMSIEEFRSLYEGWYGNAIGAIWFSDSVAPTTTEAPTTEAPTTEAATAEATNPVDSPSNLLIQNVSSPVTEIEKQANPFPNSFPYQVDEENHFISQIPEKTNAKQIRSFFVETPVLFLSSDGKGMNENTAIGTGDMLRFTQTGDQYIFCVSGDVNGDGRTISADARLVLREVAHLSEKPFAAEALFAADMDQNGKLTSADARLILRQAAGLAKI